MEKLDQNWLTNGLIDFEYKKYILLSYLKHVKGYFNEYKLYPQLSDLLFHFKNLKQIKENKKLLYENFPKKISKADFEKLQFIYDKMVEDDDLMSELEDIIEFSLPRMKKGLEEGKGLYENIENELNLSPVGLTTLNPETGYLFIYVHNAHETKIYKYKITIFESAEEKFRGINTEFLENVSKGLANTFESIKVSLMKKYKDVKAPAAYLIDSRKPYPMDESLLPIAKRMLVRHLSGAS